MSRRRKVKPLRLVLIILIILTLFVIAFFASQLLLDKAKEIKNNIDKPNSEIVPSSNEETVISIEDYTVYYDDDEDLGFNFVVASLKFKTTRVNLYYDLSNLTNSEREIKLSDIDGYLAKLSDLSYDLSDFKLVREVKSDSNEAIVNILIPFSSKSGVLNVYNGEKLSFDLSKNNKNASVLKTYNHENQKVIETNDYEVLITENPYLSTMMMHNDEEYDASGVSVYTFKIVVNNVKNDVYIEDAIFIKDNSSDEIHALDNEYQSLKVDNIIKMPLHVGSTGALFFELYRNNDAEINYDGILRIKFSDTNNWVELKTTIK